jgi:hypothetical protein
MHKNLNIPFPQININKFFASSDPSGKLHHVGSESRYAISVPKYIESTLLSNLHCTSCLSFQRRYF